MAPTKKEKTKSDLQDAIFKFQDKKEELQELLALIEQEQQQQPFDRALIDTTMIEMVDEWETVVTHYMNFRTARCDEAEEVAALEEYTTRYKLIRKQFIETKRQVNKTVNQQITSIPEVVDQTELVQDELLASAYSRQVLEDEVP